MKRPSAARRCCFVELAPQAGLSHRSVCGGFDSKRSIIETSGAGVAFVDFDHDGWADAFVLSGTRLEPVARREQTWPAGQAPLPGEALVYSGPPCVAASSSARDGDERAMLSDLLAQARAGASH